MPLCRVIDILDSIAPNVDDAGVCVTNAPGKEKAIRALDMGLDALMKRVDAEGTLWTWYVPVYGGCFSLPEDCLEARQMWVNGISTVQRDQWYQGKLFRGLNSCGTQCESQIIDLGEFAIPHTLPKIQPIRIAFVAEYDSDAGKEINIELIDNYGQRQTETLVLKAGQEPVLTENSASDITYVGKPRTDGPIQLQLSYDNGARYFLAAYGPLVRSGAFRRKRMPQRFQGCNLVTIKGKRRFTRITSENDMLPICDRLALSFAVSAIADLRKRDHEGYNANLTFAMNELFKSMENADSPGNVAPVQVISGFGHNRSQAGGCRRWY